MPKPLPNSPTEWAPANLMTPLNVNALMAMTQPAFAAMADFNGKLCENAAKFSMEWAGFVNRRLQEDLAMPQRLVTCRSPQEVQQIYVDYWSKALTQYQDELGRLTKLGETFARQTAAAMQKHAEAVTHETQLAA